MTGESEAAYFLRREKAARQRAERAADPHIARIHGELADHYAHAASVAARQSAPPSRDTI